MPDTTQSISSNWQQVQRRIALACDRANRQAMDVRIYAVCKGQRAEDITALYHLGLRDFAQNYRDELVQTAHTLTKLADIRWHFIGRIQSRQTKDLAQWCSSVQTLASTKHAELLNRYRNELRPDDPLHVMIQINWEQEQQKSGITLEQARQLRDYINHKCPHLMLQGIMSIPSLQCSARAAQGHVPEEFVQLRKIAFEFGEGLLSLGMSGDYVSAIAAGTDIIRLGQALLGPRALPLR